ncbi:MAG: cobyrinic acid a,c-diamide synthase, partial [Deltaproteobacteria bacterium]
PFKKGPDYIDAGWLALAAGRPCYNLDSYLIDRDTLLSSFYTHTFLSEIAVIEGNRGMYDCIDTVGRTSTAELAKLLGTPLILCLDCTKTTRTLAAVVAGCMAFDRGVPLKGVVLNRVAGARHEAIVRSSIEQYCGIPVLGALPKLGRQNFPERHMGLVPTPEHDWARDSIESAALTAQKYLDLDAITDMADCTPCPEAGARTGSSGNINPESRSSRDDPVPVIGVVRDSAFQFYYPENIEALVAAGAKIVFVSPLADEVLPVVDALYIGGGFPETNAEALSGNVAFRNQVKTQAENGLPIYAECGGLMYLGRELVLEGKSYPMAGVLPAVFGFSGKPQGHGYTVVAVDGDNPYFDVGTQFKGHEFHYSRVLEWQGRDENLVFSMRRGNGFINGRDGVCYKNVLGTYTHLHALGTPSWAGALVDNARRYRAVTAPDK